MPQILHRDWMSGCVSGDVPDVRMGDRPDHDQATIHKMEEADESDNHSGA
jgi:hypothetical protein